MLRRMGIKIKQGIQALAQAILTIEAEGNCRKAKEWIARLGVVRPEVQKALDKLQHVPVDIEPRFATAEMLAAELAGN
jgi:hypothetical protein